MRLHCRSHPLPALGLLVLCLSSGRLYAEISTDGSLGPARTLTGPDHQITADLGQQTGTNLFHSFHLFSILQGERATFSGPHTVQNVVSRVTGGKHSLIDGGLYSTIPGANLYLLNPAGVLIGENASLNIGGSLFLSSANYLEFSDGVRFSTTETAGTVLSVAAPSSFGFVSATPGPIDMNGSHLEVADGKGIALIGGDLTVHGGSMTAPQGALTLSSVSGPATVALDGETHTSGAAADQGAVHLGQGASLSASGSVGGRIFIRGGNIVAEKTQVLSQTLGASPGKGIHIQGSETITLDAAEVQSVAAGAGDAGPIRLEAPAVTLKGSSRVLNSSFDTGRGGSTEIQAGTLRIEQGSNIENQAMSMGDAGAIDIRADERLELIDRTPDDPDRTLILVGSRGEGGGGTLHITAASVILDGGRISASGWSNGRAGDVKISAGDLSLQHGAAILANSQGLGNGGDIRIETTDDIRILGAPQGERGTGIFANTLTQGNAGSIMIRAGGTVEIVGGAGQDASTGIQSATVGSGAAGSIRIESGGLRMEHARISVITEGAGNAGQVEIDLSGDLELDGGRIRASSVGSGASGDIEVHAGNIELRDGAEISNEDFTRVLPSGDIRVTAAGSLTIVGRGEGRSPNPGADRVSTGILSFTGDVSVSASEILIRDSGAISTRTTGDLPAGILTITADRIALLDGAEISADAIGSSLTSGSAGRVVVKAAQSLRVSGEIEGRRAGIHAGSRSSGDAGLIEVSAPLIIVENRGLLNTSTGVFTDNSAGGISLQAERLILRDGGGVLSTSVGHAGQGGNIQIHAGESLEIADGGFVSAWGFREGHSGRITIDSPRIVLHDGQINTANFGTQKAGDITIEADQIDILGNSIVQSNTSDAGGAGTGDAGSVTIVASRLINAGGSQITTEADRAGGGNILLLSRTIRLRGTPITATVAGGTGDGGNVTLAAAAISATQDSDITARADQGRGGRILINADVFLRDPTVDLDASSNVTGNEGVVEVNAPELDLSASIKELKGGFLDVAAMLRDKCSAGAGADQGSLVVRGQGSLPPGPEDYLMGSPSDYGASMPLGASASGQGAHAYSVRLELACTDPGTR